MLQEEKMEGKLEGKIEARREDIMELLEELGDVPENLQNEIDKQKILKMLRIFNKGKSRKVMIRFPAFYSAPGGARFLRVQVPNSPGSGKDIAEGKGVHREVESEGSRMWETY